MDEHEVEAVDATGTCIEVPNTPSLLVSSCLVPDGLTLYERDRRFISFADFPRSKEFSEPSASRLRCKFGTKRLDGWKLKVVGSRNDRRDCSSLAKLMF